MGEKTCYFHVLQQLLVKVMTFDLIYSYWHCKNAVNITSNLHISINITSTNLT